MTLAPTPLTSDDHLKLARRLSDMLIDTIRSQPGEDDKLVAGFLSGLRDVVWPEGSALSKEGDLVKVFHRFAKLDVVQKTKLLEAYARMGHLYEIAGQAARKNYFDNLEQTHALIPGGVKEFIDSQLVTNVHKQLEISDSARLLTEQMSQPVFEVIMTAHPTNTNSLESMRAQREIAVALEAHDEARLKEAVGAYQQTPILHQVNGEDTHFTVRDETRMMLNYLGNIYDDLPKVYAAYDDPMRTHFGDAYDPAALHLNMRFGSWGSAGDKDGNDSVTAELTLEAIARHTAAIIERYRADLQHIDGLDEWKENLRRAADALKPLLIGMEKLSDESAALRKGSAAGEAEGLALEERFDDASKRLQSVRSQLDADAFERAIAQARGSAAGDEQTKRLLDLARKVRTFGFNFAKIEYRETAKEYHRVASCLLEKEPGNFADADPGRQAEQLTRLLQERNGGKAREILQAMHARIAGEGAVQAYDKKNPLPIAYHTMKRMELACDFPDMIRDNVLAECGRIEKAEFKKKFGREITDDDVKHTGVVNVLEAQLVQRMVEKDGRKPLLGIVPLFEEPDTMKRIDIIMEGVYQNKACRAHMQELKHAYKRDEEVQQVQIAHSDNARRSGLLAARAYIHEAHRKMRDLSKRYGIKIEFFEGGSVSDAYRNGVRAVSATVNAFDLQDFAKLTYQGGDLLNYFNAPSSTVRVFTRNLSKSAERFSRDENGKWKALQRPANLEQKRAPNALIDQLAIDALQLTLDDYASEDFKKDKMGLLLAALDYTGETKAGNRGSRAGSRSAPVAFGKVESAQEGVREGIDVEDLRTIAFSEAWQQSGIVPSWIGSQKLADHLFNKARKLRDEINQKPQDNLTMEERYFMQKFGNLGNEPLSPVQIHEIYEKSPTFRDAQDRAAFALAMTDPQSLKWLGKRLSQAENSDTVRSVGGSYLEHVKQTHEKAGKLALAALRASTVKDDDKPEDKDKTVRAALTESLDRLTGDIVRKTHYRDFLLYTKIHGGIFPSLHTGSGRGSLLKDQKVIDHLRGVVHNGGDTVVHGRFLMADDPAYGESRTAGDRAYQHQRDTRSPVGRWV